MKLRYLVILGILVFLNGFVFTVLLLMVSRELTHAAATPTMLATVTPVMQPTYTSTPAGPTPTSTAEPTATNTPEPAATNTLVVGAATPTNTTGPTATFAPATDTPTGGAATATTVPPTATATTAAATATPTPTATPTTPSYEFEYAGGMESAPNCGMVYMEGKITGVGGEPVSGRTVRLRFAGNEAYRVSGEEGKPAGEWGFSPLAPENFHLPFTFLIDVVESSANPIPQSDTVEIQFTDCGVAGQFTNIVFQYAR
jgi:cytoskeletal protein RodZ